MFAVEGGPIAQVITGPAGPVIGFALAVVLAWGAADLLDARNRTAAVLVAAALSLAMPYILADVIERLAGSMTSAEPRSLLEIYAPHMLATVTRVGFALIGVLAWCGYEQSRRPH